MAVEGEKKLQFRNYIPKYKGLQEHCLPKPGVADLEESLDKKIEEAIAKAQQEDQVFSPFKRLFPGDRDESKMDLASPYFSARICKILKHL